MIMQLEGGIKPYCNLFTPDKLRNYTFTAPRAASAWMTQQDHRRLASAGAKAWPTVG